MTENSPEAWFVEPRGSTGELDINTILESTNILLHVVNSSQHMHFCFILLFCHFGDGGCGGAGLKLTLHRFEAKDSLKL